jgi:hypothetical protein
MTAGERARPKTRGSNIAAILAGILVSLVAAEALHAALTAGAGRQRREAMQALTVQLGLTDLALFTEARYTRHRSLADLHSAFQDAPMAMEHFPAGSLVAPQRAFPPSALRSGTGE